MNPLKAVSRFLNLVGIRIISAAFSLHNFTPEEVGCSVCDDTRYVGFFAASLS